MSRGLRCVQAHQIVIADRGGARKIAQLRDVSTVAWGRKRSAMSQATITLAGAACDRQASALADIRPRRHEMVIYRDSVRVWEGPIVDIAFRPESIEIVASDVLEYLAGTALSQWWPSEDDGGPGRATDRIDAIIRHELTTPYTRPLPGGGTRTFTRWEAQTPPANILPFLDVRASDVVAGVETLPFSMSVFEHLDALAKLGLQYTALGRSIVIADGAAALGQTRRLGPSDLGERPTAYASSRNFAAIQHVVGQATNDPEDLDAIGTAGEVDPYYGPWEVIDSAQEVGEDEDIEDAVVTQAETLYAKRRGMRIDLETPDGSSVMLDDTLTLASLVPGAVVPVSGTVNRLPLSARYVITEVNVSEDGQGEKIGVKLATQEELNDG